ncbi:hypothetical protein TrRE_jg7183 [Triparma retinervis]|uniref:N-acetyltransferase domain-containing protein n=1 Tax=Triparma retinervis TaxID=2557542 RepID=A0A9W7A0I5_9STRA|nr:hypothetical protein TrRE_jg7183 [Triparma retinervis]
MSSTLSSIISSSTSDVKQIRELDKELRNVNEEVELLSQISLVALEGKNVEGQLARGQRVAGDLIPWTLAQQLGDSDFAQRGEDRQAGGR